MPNAEHLSTYFEILQLVLLALLGIRLAVLGLWRSYPVFFTYILVQIPHGIVPLVISIHSNSYLHYWLDSQPVIYIIQILLVAELCRLVLAGHPGIYTLGKWAMTAAVVVALAISLLSLIPHIKPHTPQISQRLQYYFAAQRGLDFGLGLFLLLMIAFISRYPFGLSRNTLIHAGLYTFYFFSETLGIFLHTLFGIDETAVINLSLTIVACGCLVAWLLLLRRSDDGAKPRLSSTPEHESRILEQLNAFNETLTRSRKRK
jgi:hypothetical protein